MHVFPCTCILTANISFDLVAVLELNRLVPSPLHNTHKHVNRIRPQYDSYALLGEEVAGFTSTRWFSEALIISSSPARTAGGETMIHSLHYLPQALR